MCGFGVVVSSWSLLIRGHKRARCQAEIPLSALSKIPEPALNRAYTNGSLHSFNSTLQIMLAIMSILGVFIVRVDGKYFLLDVFPWFGHAKEDRQMKRHYGDDWWRYGRVVADTKSIIEQGEIVILFQRCLRMVSGVGWRETIITQLVNCEERWFNRPRNNILYNFTGWTDTPDLVSAEDTDLNGLLKAAVTDIFDPDAQTAFGPLPQSLLLMSLLTSVWSTFRGSVAIELNGLEAPEFPPVGENSLIALFENVLAEMLARSA